MDPSCSELEFFDFSNATEEEIKEVREILRLSSSNGFVELPWEIPVVEECSAATPITEQDRSEVEVSAESQKPFPSQNIPYVLPHPSVTSAPIVPPQPIAAPPLQNPDLLPVDTTYVQPPPTVTTIGHYPNGPYVISRTYPPYMRAYPHLGVPLFTCALPGSNEMRDLNPMQPPPPYGQFVPLAAAVPQMDKHTEMKDMDMRSKPRGSSDRQFSRRNKKKHLPSNSYGNPEMGGATDSYQESIVTDEQMSQTLHQGPVDIGDNLPSVTSSVPLVPLPVPPSTFAVTSGAIPMHGYPPPGLHTLPYSQISGPQTPSTPVYYVPVFNHHPYASYIPSPTSGPMILPMGVGNIHPVSDSNSILEEQVSNNVVAAETSGVSQTSLEHIVKPNTSSPDTVVSNTKAVDTAKPSSEVECTSPVATTVEDEKESVKITCENTENTNTLHEAMSKVTLKDNCIQGRSEPQDSCAENSRLCWADLFKKQCPELNGLDRQSCASDSESSNGHTINKDISNGKLYSVPGSEDIL